MRNHLSAFALAAALLAPGAILADKDKDDKHHGNRRYYDRDVRDYHEWNEGEDRAYRHYLQEQRRENHEWQKANRKEQKEYWKWRHKHPDAIIFPPR